MWKRASWCYVSRGPKSLGKSLTGAHKPQITYGIFIKLFARSTILLFEARRCSQLWWPPYFYCASSEVLLLGPHLHSAFLIRTDGTFAIATPLRHEEYDRFNSSPSKGVQDA